MSLTKDEFRTSLSKLHRQQQHIQLNEWSWEKLSSSNNVYLKKTSYLQVQVDKDEDNEPIDIFIKLEYHIVYSSSYRVPTLYFQPSYYQDGSPLSLQEIYQHIVPKSYHHNLQNHHYIPCISQTEHPLLGTPFWYIHPCETSTLMSTIIYDKVDYVRTWLSFVGPAIQCSIPKELFLL